MGVITGLAAFLNAIRFSDVIRRPEPAWNCRRSQQRLWVGSQSQVAGERCAGSVLAGVLLLASIAPGLVFLHSRHNGSEHCKGSSFWLRWLAM